MNFKDVPIGVIFTIQGHECKKASTRTAKLLASNRTTYFGMREDVQPMSATELECFTWFERDRQQVGLRTPGGHEVFCLNDDAVTQAVEDGFLTTPRFGSRAKDSEWHLHAVSYAISQGYWKELS